MLRYLLIGGLMVSPASAETVRFLQCPLHLTYCYYEYKKVEPRKRSEDIDLDFRKKVIELMRQGVADRRFYFPNANW
jgi:hypothetical protein